jgi:site-specific DNA recombinase
MRFIYRRTGASVPISAVHSILRNRLYTGQFEWNGKLIQGRHQPLISVELWERVQGVLDGRNAGKAKRGKHDFAFSGLIACAKNRYRFSLSPNLNKLCSLTDARVSSHHA